MCFESFIVTKRIETLGFLLEKLNVARQIDSGDYGGLFTA